MTAHRDLKKIIRDRQQKTGESYSTARAHVMHARSERLGLSPEAPMPVEQRFEAVVLKVNRQSARVRILGEDGQLTFRSADAGSVVPGQVVTLVLEKRWTWRDAYASGKLEDPRIDVSKLGLVPLPLDGGELINLRTTYEPYRRPDPYAPLWRKLTAKPRASFEMDPIAWGFFPGSDPEEDPTSEAAELSEAGDVEGARELLMETLLRDVRCIDAHAHLGNLEFERFPKRAIVHYEIGIRIGEQSLPPDFDGVLLWGRTYNRPFLRCLHGHALCLWRLGRLPEAQRVFERILSLNPNDNQGVRFAGRTCATGGPGRKRRSARRQRGTSDSATFTDRETGTSHDGTAARKKGTRKTLAKKKPAALKVFQLKITLEAISPPIWRRVHVPADLRLDGLHRVVQAVMGWTNSHSHDFKYRDRRFSDPTFDEDGGLEIDDEYDVTLGSLVTRVRGQKLRYRYDFGDSWRHEILFERTFERVEGVTYPVCVGGARACPPEDVGGVGGYWRFLEVLGNAEHPDHHETLSWIGAFEPDGFDVNLANRALRRCESWNPGLLPQ